MTVLQDVVVVLPWTVVAAGIVAAFPERYSVVDIGLVHWAVRPAAGSVVDNSVAVVLRTAAVAGNTVAAVVVVLVGTAGKHLLVEVCLAAGTVGIRPHSAADFVVAEVVAVGIVG